MAGRGSLWKSTSVTPQTEAQQGTPPATAALWVVGLIEWDATGQRKSAFLLTRRRSADVLVPFIRQHVARGSILISDEWRGYSRELARDYVRLTINHSVQYGYTVNFNGQRLSVNTNHIEREWVEVRKILKNIPEDRYNKKLDEEVFRMLYFKRCRIHERPFIFLEKMAETMHSFDLFSFFLWSFDRHNRGKCLKSEL